MKGLSPRFAPRLFAPRGLFFKIFAWFLLAQLLIALALYLVAAATQRGLDEHFNNMAGDNLEVRARAAAISYEAGGLKALREVWVFPRGPGRFPPNQSVGSDVPPDGEPPDDGNFPPDGADGPPDGGGRNRGHGRGGGPENFGAASFYQLRKRSGAMATATPQLVLLAAPLWRDVPRLSASALQGADDSDVVNDDDQQFLVRHISTARGHEYVAALPLRFANNRPWDEFSWWGRGPDGLWRFAVVAFVMGALCYALARYLTAPTLQLRRATRQFAAGDLSARVGDKMGKRRDELADLGRDFDQMAEQIEGLLVSQRQLLGDISHELRSPLTRLSLALELAQGTADPKTQGSLARIASEVGEINTLIGQLLTLTRLENAPQAPREGSSDAAYIDLEGLVEHVAQNADFEAKSRGGSVTITHSDQCQIVGNGELLRSAVENVVRNAILHSPDAPRVEISLHVAAEVLQNIATIKVRDHGVGVPSESLDKLFEPFYRVDPSRVRQNGGAQSGGTGLGLSITQRAARSHGGDVRARNAEGGGLEVEISLPLQRESTPVE